MSEQRFTYQSESSTRALEFRVFDCLLEEVRDTTNQVAIEEPLHIYADGQPVAESMRLPGEEIELAVGICFTQGLIESAEDIETVTHPFRGSKNRIAIIRRRAKPPAFVEEAETNKSFFYNDSAVSTKEIVSEIREHFGTAYSSVRSSVPRIIELQHLMARGQQMFRTTGCTHAAGIFSGDGELIAFAEDIGRHNAFDKVIGKVLLSGEKQFAKIAALTSRLSFEMVQKAGRMKLEIVSAVSAPTSLGIELAKALNITLVGFSRQNRANIYSCPERLLPDATVELPKR